MNILSSKPKSRAILAFFIFFTLLFSLALLMFVTDRLISLAERFQELSSEYAILFSSLLLFFTLFTGWIIYRLIFPKTKRIVKNDHHTDHQSEKETILKRINQARDEGVSNEIAENNLLLLDERSSEQTIYIAMFGEINMGKTAIVSALLPNIPKLPKQKLVSEAVGGTTKSINQYSWKIDETEIIVSDLPGTGQTNTSEHTSLLTAQETIQAHIVLYICAGDINKQQYDELLQILLLNKPTIIVINKTDQYTADEQQNILQRLQMRFNNEIDITVPEAIVCVNSGGFESVIKIDEKGNESTIERAVPINVSALKEAIQTVLISKKGHLSELRNQAVLNAIANQLDIAEQKLKLKQAQDIAQQYTRKAVVGALAAVSPGTDVIIQAYLGTSMVKEICAIYQIKVSKFDVNTLLKLIQNQVGRLLPLILTITGNALKAFPGVGTLAGGIIHAVAYGMVFNALGKSLIKTLSKQTDLKPAETAKVFQEMLSGNMEKDTTNIIKLVLQEKNRKK